MSLDGTYGALAHAVRRELISRIAPAPTRVTDLAVGFPISLVAVSKHIRVLETAGLVHREVRGRQHLLTLEPAPLAGAADWLSSYRRFWDDRLDALESRLREPGTR